MATLVKSRLPNLKKFIMQEKPRFIQAATNLSLYGLKKKEILKIVQDAIAD